MTFPGSEWSCTEDLVPKPNPGTHSRHPLNPNPRTVPHPNMCQAFFPKGAHLLGMRKEQIGGLLPAQNFSVRSPRKHPDIFTAGMEMHKGILSPHPSLARTSSWPLNPKPKPDPHPHRRPQFNPTGISWHSWPFSPCHFPGLNPNPSRGLAQRGFHFLGKNGTF